MTSPGTGPEDWEAFIQWPASPSPTDTTDTISALSSASPLTLPPDNATSIERADMRDFHASDSTVSEETIVTLPNVLPSTPRLQGDVSTSRACSNSAASAIATDTLSNGKRPLRSVHGVKKVAHNRLLAPRPSVIEVPLDDGIFVPYSPHGSVAKKPKTRNKFSDDKKKETAQIRKDGSCVSCRLRKVRVRRQRSPMEDMPS